MLKKPETLFVLGYMLLPLLALLSAIVGLTMILGGNKIAGAIVLVVVTQAFAFGAVYALRLRGTAARAMGRAAHRDHGAALLICSGFCQEGRGKRSRV